jgi:hypothetical protein
MLLKLALSLATVLAGQPAAPPVKAPRDFALRLEFGCSVPDVINTTAGTYEVPTSRGRQAASVHISSKLKDQLFNLVTEQQFFSLQPRVVELGLCEPSTNYTLWVTADGRSHTVFWTDCQMEPSTDNGRRVRALGDGIVQPFRKMRAVQQVLKLPRFYCL